MFWTPRGAFFGGAKDTSLRPRKAALMEMLLAPGSWRWISMRPRRPTDDLFPVPVDSPVGSAIGGGGAT